MVVNNTELAPGSGLAAEPSAGTPALASEGLGEAASMAENQVEFDVEYNRNISGIPTTFYLSIPLLTRHRYRHLT